MTLRSLWSHFKGYVIIRITGKAVEDFINQAYASEIELWNLMRIDGKSVLTCIYLQDLPRAGKILKTTNCKGRVERRVGLPFLIMKLAKRKGFIFGALLFSVGLYVLSSFVWFISISGCDKISCNDIAKFVEEQGIKVGTPRGRVDPASLGKGILAEFPSLAWVGVNIKGTTVSIEVSEKTLPETEPELTHLIASEDALVVNIIVFSGEPAVNEGDTVTRGQTLIEGSVCPPLGYEKDGEEKKEFISAKGVVMGRVWRTYRDSLNLIRRLETETGEIKRTVYFFLGPYEFRIGPKEPPFKTYVEKRSVYGIPSLEDNNVKSAVRLTVIEYKKTERSIEILDRKEILGDLRKKAYIYMKAKMPRGAKILDEREDLEYSAGGEWVYTLTIETIEDIAQEMREHRS